MVFQMGAISPVGLLKTVTTTKFQTSEHPIATRTTFPTGDITNGTSMDCDNNTVPDECELGPDCNQNQIPDRCELAGNDCNNNGVPDDCDSDCDASGLPDDCENLDDCDGNGTPDDCEPSDDCNGSGVPDRCELGGNDCNANAILTIVNLIAIKMACEADCNQDGQPDDCQGLEDCDGNGIPDDCENLEDCDDDGVHACQNGEDQQQRHP